MIMDIVKVIADKSNEKVTISKGQLLLIALCSAVISGVICTLIATLKSSKKAVATCGSGQFDPSDFEEICDCEEVEVF